MSATTGIEWTDVTWNPVTGCTKVSQGCKHCYAERLFPRVYPGRAFTDVQCHPERLDQPLHWRKPRRVFVNSMSDLFHEAVPDAFIYEIFRIMARTPQHTYQILTKRIERVEQLDLCTWWEPHIWLGVSIESPVVLGRGIQLVELIGPDVKFLSCEPLLASLNLGNLLYGID